MDGGQIAGAVGVAIFSGYNVYIGQTQGRVWTKRGSIFRDKEEKTFQAIFAVYALMGLGAIGVVLFGFIQNLG